MQHRDYVIIYKKRSNFYKILLLFIVFSLSAHLNAASFRPIITNFTPNEYGQEAGLQNWDCTQDEGGTMYFANNRGLLVYDGHHWEKVLTPDNTLVRSVKAIGNRIYVGTYAQFGYFERDAYGTLRFTSLLPFLKGYTMQHEEPWNIIAYDGKIYFQSFASIIVYDPKANGGHGEAHAVCPKGQAPLYLHRTRNRLWAQIIGGDYCSFDGRRYQSVISRADVGQDDVVANVDLKRLGSMLLATVSHGLYLYDGHGTVKPFVTDIDQQLKRENVNRMTLIDDHTIVIGTILGGIYAIDLQGHRLWHYRMPDGLVNNSVLRLFCDGNHNVWACLDGGIALIHSGLPFTYLSPVPWDQPIGMVYDLHIVNHQLLMATNQGLYTYGLNATEMSPQLVQGTQGQNWHITAIEKQLFVGSNNSTYEYSNGALTRIAGFSTSSTSIQECTLYGKHILLETSYNNLRIYRKDAAGRWQMSHNVEGLAAPVRNCIVAGDGEIWAANLHKGYFRLRLSQDLRRVKEISFHERVDSTSTASTCYVMSIKGHVVIADQERLYIYDDMTDRVVPFDRLNDVLPETGNIHYATPYNGGYWITGKSGFAFVTAKHEDFVLQHYIPLTMTGLLGNDTRALTYIDGQHAYFNMANGVLRYNLHQRPAKQTQQSHVMLLQGIYLDRDGKEQPLRLSDVMNGKARVENNVKLRFSYPDYDHLSLHFRFTLSQGSSKRVIMQDHPLFEVNNLDFGHYVLRVEAIAAGGQVVDALQVKFRVKVPWYLSFWAFLFYIAAVTSLAWLYGHVHTRRALARQKSAFEADAREQHIKVLEQERVIADQQRQILETELSSQSKELASLALDTLSKEQVIDSLRDTMQEQQRSQRGGHFSQRDLTPLMQRMRQAEGNLEFWSIYQKNFDLIHEHFFRNLQERYPTLTTTDLKFCALLRLNLSTKDIAKFANISVRGVESARLRLRRKFDLQPEQNLVEFLISMK